jgi:large subunit ribosomal protein L29
MKKVTDLKKMTIDELQSELLNLRKEQFNLRMKKVNGVLDQTHVIRNVRKTIARVKTIMTEKAGNSHV